MGATDNMLCFALYSATRRTTRTYRELLEPWGLTYPQFLTLYVLWDQGPQSVRALGELMDLDTGTVSPLIKRLEKAGYLMRRRDPIDERVVNVELTHEGESLREPLSEIPRKVAAVMDISDDEYIDDLIERLKLLTNQKNLSN